VAPIRVQRLIEDGVNNSQISFPAAPMSYLLLICTCLYDPIGTYIMYTTLLSFSIWQHLFEGGYYYAHFGAACGGYTSAATI